jgi:hypothetical protein
MELLTIREPSLGTFVESIQEAVLQGYRHSSNPKHYSWQDNQYNAILERSDTSVEPSTQKKPMGRPPRTN